MRSSTSKLVSARVHRGARRRRRAQKIQIKRAGATFPTPIYSKWFPSTTSCIRRADQLSVDRFGRRCPTDLQADRVLRRVGYADERGAVARGAGKIMHFRRARGGRTHLQHPNVTAELKFNGPLLATSSSARSRNGMTRASPSSIRASPCRPATSPSCIARTGPARRISGRLSCEDLRPNGDQGRRQQFRQLADRRRRRGNEGVATP